MRRPNEQQPLPQSLQRREGLRQRCVLHPAAGQNAGQRALVQQAQGGRVISGAALRGAAIDGGR